MALEWLGRAESEQTERIAGSIFSETASATDQETQKYAPVVSTTNASETPSIDADTPSIVAGESAEQSWLAEELLEHVFG